MLGQFPWVFNPIFLFINFVADILILPISIKTLWIDIEYNAFFFVDMILNIFLTPYYMVAFVIVVFDAMKNRDMYDDDELAPLKRNE